MDLLEAMSVFVRVVESGSLTAAADRCAISPTMVGNHLRALEKHLGATLLQRTTRRQRLTEFGVAYYDRCIEILGLVADTDSLAQRAQAEPRGRLRITAPVTFGTERLAARLAEYLTAHSAVDLEIVLTDRVVDLLGDGFDAAIRLGAIEPSRLVARRLADYPMVVCASPDYCRRKGTPASPQDLGTHDCLAFAYAPNSEWSRMGKEWHAFGPEGEETIVVRSRVVINSAQGLRIAAVAGAGIAMLPTVLVSEDLRAGRLVHLFPEYRTPSRPLHVVFPSDRYRSPKLRSFVDFLMQTFGREL
ncbi:MAG: LysR family transcriptional regulator [Acidiferrobacter sp.]